jgi:hypothetical protein
LEEKESEMMNPSASSLHSRREALGLGASGLGLAVAGSVLNAVRAQATTDEPGAPRSAGPLQSAGAMTFGPGNVLFVGDIAGSAVHAFALRDEDLTPQTGVELGNFHNFEGVDLVRGLDVKLAALLGTTYDNIVINDMVVHQPTGQIFLSVERGRGADAIPAIVKVNRGKLELLKRDGIPHSKVSVPNEPDQTARLEFEPQQVYAITDVKYYNGEVFVTGISNQRFASTLYRIPYPFTDQKATTTVEIWHPTHGEFETRAPIIRQLVLDVGGQPHLFGVYGCTPLVRFPLAALNDGAHVRGDTIGELGYGSNPVDMLTFNNPFDHKDYLLVTIDVRGGMQIAVADLGTAPPEPTGGPIDFGPGGLGKTQRELPIRAEHMAMLNSRWGVVIWRHPKTAYRLDLGTLMSPYFFDRRLGMSEMNWPDGPDPFEYRKHRNEIDRI